MDSSLIQTYRLVMQDCVLLYDVFSLTTNSIRGLPSVREYLDAVQAVILEESRLKRPRGDDADSLLQGYSSPMGREKSAGKQSINLIWEYFHSVLLPFVVEELSQYPFWAAKVSLLTDDVLLDSVKDMPLSAMLKPESLATKFFSHIATKAKQQGLLALFEGSLSFMSIGACVCARLLASANTRFWHLLTSLVFSLLFLLALRPQHKPRRLKLSSAFVANFQHIEDVSRIFLVDLMATLPRSLSSSGSKQTMLPSRKPGTGSTKKYHQNKRSQGTISTRTGDNVGNYRNSAANASPTWRAFALIASTVLTHPMLLLAVTSVRNSEFRGYSPLYSYFVLVSRQGFRRGLFTGLRSAMFVAFASASVAPLSPAVFCGVPEMIMYRCILRRSELDSDSTLASASVTSPGPGPGPGSGSGSGSGSRSSAGLAGTEYQDTTGGIVSVAKYLLNRHGVLSLLNYGYLTALQLAPGLITFVTGAFLSLSL